MNMLIENTVVLVTTIVKALKTFTNNRITTSRLERYAFAILEQKISAKYLMLKRDRGAGKDIKI